MVHGHLHHLAERVGQLIVLVMHDAQHPLGRLHPVVDVGVVADLDARATIVDGKGQRVLADHAHGRELDLQGGGSVMAVGEQQELVGDIVADHADDRPGSLPDRRVTGALWPTLTEQEPLSSDIKTFDRAQGACALDRLNLVRALMQRAAHDHHVALTH